MHAGAPEDEKIAKNVSGIDVIIAGHTHDLYPKPKKVNQTIISQVGSYGQYLGVLQFEYENGQVVHLNQNPHFFEINDSVESDPEYLSLTEDYLEDIDYLIRPLGYSYSSPIYTSEIKLKKSSRIKNKWGQLITSGIREELNNCLLYTSDAADE